MRMLQNMLQRIKQFWCIELAKVPVWPRLAMISLIVINEDICGNINRATIIGYRWLQVTYCPCDECKAERAAKAGGGI